MRKTQIEHAMIAAELLRKSGATSVKVVVGQAALDVQWPEPEEKPASGHAVGFFVDHPAEPDDD